MQIKSRIKLFLSLMVILIFSSMTVLAATPSSVQNKYSSLTDGDKSKIVVSGDKSSISVDGNSIPSSASAGDGLAAVNIGGSTVYMNQANIDALENALSSFASSSEQVRNDKSSKGAKNKLSNLEKAFDVNADIDNAALVLSGFRGIISVTVGLILYAVVILFGLLTAVDIAYITISPLRNFLDEKGELARGRTSDGSPKMRILSDEAIYALRNATLENGKNPLVTYIGKRAFGVIMLGIAVYILATGNFGLLMHLSLNLVSGIIDMISKLAGA